MGVGDLAALSLRCQAEVSPPLGILFRPCRLSQRPKQASIALKAGLLLPDGSVLSLKVWMVVSVSNSFMQQIFMRTHSSGQASHHLAFMEFAFWSERLLGAQPHLGNQEGCLEEVATEPRTARWGDRDREECSRQEEQHVQSL